MSPKFFYYANALKYLGLVAFNVYLLNGNVAHAKNMQACVFVCIVVKWAAFLFRHLNPV